MLLLSAATSLAGPASSPFASILAQEIAAAPVPDSASAPLDPEPETGPVTDVLPVSDPSQEVDAPAESPDTEDFARIEPDAPERTVMQEIERVEAYLTGLQTVAARFTQVGPDNVPLTGDFWLDRPGRVRFEYDAPSPILIVADGSTVAIADTALETVERGPIRSTPMRWLLSETLNLADSGAVLDAARFDGVLYFTLQDPEGETEGRLTLIFDDADPALPVSAMAFTGWYAIDAMGGLTQFRFEDIRLGDTLDPRLFILDDPEEDGRRGRRR
ncbi:MAG: outer membrane lipoprotein carrier protein LolA [Pseudomonadota bacterium]